jgi:hypothetical protein
MSHQERNRRLVQQIVGHQQIGKADAPLPLSMTGWWAPYSIAPQRSWLEIPQAPSCRARSEHPLTAVSFFRFFNNAEIDARHGAVFDPLPVIALRGAQAMAAAAIHVVPDNNFDDWVVRADIGQEFGYYPIREAAERVAQAIAQEREVELVVHLPDGKTSRTCFTKSWAARLFRR